jgi:hypothetical protein
MAEPVVYDKAKYHTGGDYPPELPADQAFVHTGFYLGWVIERGLTSAEFAEYAGEQIAAFRARARTGPEVYEWCDGALLDDMLSAEGNAFSEAYFDFSRGRFLADYEELLAEDLPSLYHVADTWENYERLKERLDARYSEWKAGGGPFA